MVSEKITINSLPKKYKDMAIEIKDELNTSLNSAYIEIFSDHYKRREIEKMTKSAEIMATIYKEDEELKDWVSFEEDTHDYSSR